MYMTHIHKKEGPAASTLNHDSLLKPAVTSPGDVFFMMMRCEMLRQGTVVPAGKICQSPASKCRRYVCERSLFLFFFVGYSLW